MFEGLKYFMIMIWFQRISNSVTSFILVNVDAENAMEAVELTRDLYMPCYSSQTCSFWI